ncbi:MAG: phosphate acyltransferase PlsX [Candidatus Hydrogenedentota bacterium]
MRIALDANGSDRAPGPEVEAALSVARDPAMELLLVGDETQLHEALHAQSRGKIPSNISVVHASESISMQDSPVLAVRQKKDASLLVAMRLVKNGEASAYVSAGNTGAVMVAARTILGLIKGVGRSAICQRLPTLREPALVLDLGANVDCSARHLCDFAEMGAVYARHGFNVDSPRVGLLNIGEEQAKGNELAKQVHRCLSATPHINFIGNVEPKGLFEGGVDVVVCDGFVGNVVLKTSEAVAGLITQLVHREVKATWTSTLGAQLSSGAFRRLKHIIDPNEHPGAMLIGVNGIVFILHGASTATGVANAIIGAQRAVEKKINEHIRQGIEELRDSEAYLNQKEQGA